MKHTSCTQLLIHRFFLPRLIFHQTSSGQGNNSVASTQFLGQMEYSRLFTIAKTLTAWHCRSQGIYSNTFLQIRQFPALTSPFQPSAALILLQRDY
jgi:hypothetical protein